MQLIGENRMELNPFVLNHRPALAAFAGAGIKNGERGMLRARFFPAVCL